MGIHEEIFDELFKKLKEDETFPKYIIEELKKTCENGEIISKDKIYEIIKNGCENVSKD